MDIRNMTLDRYAAIANSVLRTAGQGTREPWAWHGLWLHNIEPTFAGRAYLA